MNWLQGNDGLWQCQAVKILSNGIAVLDGDSHISRWVEEEGRLDHDQNALPIILGYIKDGDVVVDAGAFIGDHTIAYTKAVGKTGRVMAFEPNPSAYECLVHNCPEAMALNLGLSDRSGELKMAIDVNAGASHVGDGGQLINVVALDSMPFQRLNFIKMDVEGMELRALLGAKKTIEAHRPIMWIEINVGALKRQGVVPAQIFDVLHGMGYEFEPYPDEGGMQYDILCVAK